MKKIILVQFLRMALVFAALVALVVWQSHFIMSGINSNPYLNTVIIGVFGFGSMLALKSLFGLRNDVKAFAALKDIYDEIQRERHDPHIDQRQRRLSLCLTPGIVYRSPDLLGHVFDLTLDELLRTRHMRISIATMQHLLQAIDTRMAHQRSLMGYLTGLSVFLGLIGTFIGLMEMVGSVGGIIGGLANGDSASADTIKRLIHDLEAPLVGMATGFSCSLFGLFGSLMLGIFGRFVSAGAHGVKEEFESWLAGIAQIETRQSENLGGSEWSALPQVAAMSGDLANAITQAGASISQVSLTLRRVSERQDFQAELLERTCRLLTQAAENDRVSLQALQRTEAVGQQVAALREDVARQTAGLRQAAMSGFEQIARLAHEQRLESQDAFATMAGMQEHSTAILRQVQADTSARALEPLLADQIAGSVAAGVGDLASALDGVVRDVGRELARLSDEQRATTIAMSVNSAPAVASELRVLGQSLQDGLTDGLTEVSRALEHAFASFAVIARQQSNEPRERAAPRTERSA
jgi:hypothetical protein